MFNNKFSLLSLLFIILVLNINIYSQDYLSQTHRDAFRLSQPGIIYDARSLSMGNAYSIIGNTYTATLMNPATLGLAKKTTFSGSINLNLYYNEVKFLSDSLDSHKTETTISQFGVVYPVPKDSVGKNLVFSLGYNKSNDFNRIVQFEAFNASNSTIINDLTGNNSEITRSLQLSYPVVDSASGNFLGDATILNGNLNQKASVLDEGSINHWSFGFAYEFASNVFFGASVNYSVGSYLNNREYFEIDTKDIYGTDVRTLQDSALTAGFNEFYLNDVVDWSYNGWDVRFGFLYKFFDFIGIGGSVKIPTQYSIIEKHHFNGTSSFATGLINELDIPVIETKYGVTSPFEFTAGAAVNLWIITATAEATYIDYTQMKFSGDMEVPKKAALNKDILERYTQIVNLRAGAEFRLPWTGLSARAGFIYNMSPLKDTPTDYDKKYLTAGLGISSGEGDFEMNLVGMLGWWDIPSEDFGGNIPTISQSIVEANILVSFTLRSN
ncbi:MAG: hypothetical protein IIA49_03080 [Bacteroidetes bacterium]|nr:hypothetical protein [Bacteroidota bacterium]MCH7769991.1 hypothetical protein [Bacteroidota bacterium]